MNSKFEKNVKQKIGKMIVFQNPFLNIEIETSPFTVRMKRDGKEILSAGSGRFIADRSDLPEETFLKESRLSETQYLLEYRRGGLHITRHLEVYEQAPAIRCFGTVNGPPCQKIRHMIFSPRNW